MTGFKAISVRTQPSCNLAQAAAQAIIQANAVLATTSKKVKITSQLPSAIGAGETFSSLTVEFRDENDLLVTDAQASVTLSIVSGTGSRNAKLLGTTRVVAKNGIAEFKDISIDKVGSNYMISASSGSLTNDVTTVFSVTPGEPEGLRFSVQPAGAVLNVGFTQKPQVSIIDFYGNTVYSPSMAITVVAQERDDVSGNAENVDGVSGTFTVQSVNGVVTFSDINFSSTGSGLFLVASADDVSPATSTAFNVVNREGYPVQLQFRAQPNRGVAGQAFSIQPVVQVTDFDGKVVTDATGTIALSITAKTGTEGATLSGTIIRPIVNGIVQFSGISIDRAGLKYQLTASAEGLASATTAEFVVNGPSSLVFVTAAPKTLKVSETFSVKVQLKDIQDNVFTSSADSITLSVKRNGVYLSSAVLIGVTTIKVTNGEALFQDLSISAANSDLVITASVRSGEIKVDSQAFSVVDLEEVKNDDGTTEVTKTFNMLEFLASLNPLYYAAGGCVVLGLIACIATLICTRRRKGKKALAAKKPYLEPDQTAGITRTNNFSEYDGNRTYDQSHYNSEFASQTRGQSQYSGQQPIPYGPSSQQHLNYGPPGQQPLQYGPPGQQPLQYGPPGQHPMNSNYGIPNGSPSQSQMNYGAVRQYSAPSSARPSITNQGFASPASYAQSNYGNYR
jgi:uncharacterized membrane protein